MTAANLARRYRLGEESTLVIKPSRGPTSLHFNLQTDGDLFR